MTLAKKGWIEIQDNTGHVVGSVGGSNCYLPHIWSSPTQQYNTSPKPVYYISSRRSEALDCLHEAFLAQEFIGGGL